MAEGGIGLVGGPVERDADPPGRSCAKPPGRVRGDPCAVCVDGQHKAHGTQALVKRKKIRIKEGLASGQQKKQAAQGSHFLCFLKPFLGRKGRGAGTPAVIRKQKRSGSLIGSKDSPPGQPAVYITKVTGHIAAGEKLQCPHQRNARSGSLLDKGSLRAEKE
jgi:hypothetical protein